MSDLLELQRNVLVACNCGTRLAHGIWGPVPESGIATASGRIDVWLLGQLPAEADPSFAAVSASLSLAAQFGSLAKSAASAYGKAAIVAERR